MSTGGAGGRESLRREVRAFAAVALPAALREALAALQAQCRRLGLPARWVRPEGIHLTLKFLGETAPARLDEAVASLAEAGAGVAGFRVRAEGLGVFPDPRRARVLWVGVADEAGRLADLVRRVETAFARRGFPREPRPFRAHLTIGRFPGACPPEALAEALARHRGQTLGEIPVEALVLFESELRPEGARYHEIARVGLAAP